MTDPDRQPDPVCCQALRAAAVPLVLLPPEDEDAEFGGLYYTDTPDDYEGDKYA